MKILVFSDSHLTEKFEDKKFNLLKKIIQQSELVIINGDFWDGYLTTFDRFVSSQWKKLFPLLKSKKTIYLWGNHDRKIFMDKNINLFSQFQTNVYRLKIDGKNFVFEHGNRLYPTIDEKLPRSLCKYTTLIAGFLLQKIPYLKYILRRVAYLMKRKVQKELSQNEIFICGHSHWPEIDLKQRFINTGSIENGFAEYLIIENGDITSKKERYN